MCVIWVRYKKELRAESDSGSENEREMEGEMEGKMKKKEGKGKKREKRNVNIKDRMNLNYYDCVRLANKIREEVHECQPGWSRRHMNNEQLVYEKWYSTAQKLNLLNLYPCLKM